MQNKTKQKQEIFTVLPLIEKDYKPLGILNNSIFRNIQTWNIK